MVIYVRCGKNKYNTLQLELLIFLFRMMELPFSVCTQKDLESLPFPILSEMLLQIWTKSFLELVMSQSWWEFSMHTHKSLNKSRIQCTVTVSRQDTNYIQIRDIVQDSFLYNKLNFSSSNKLRKRIKVCSLNATVFSLQGQCTTSTPSSAAIFLIRNT